MRNSHMTEAFVMVDPSFFFFPFCFFLKGRYVSVSILLVPLLPYIKIEPLAQDTFCPK